jgi:ABC-2 type transport system permease protein
VDEVRAPEGAVHELADAPVRVVSARIGLYQRLKNLWGRRELLRNLISSDIRIQYKGSALGIVWSMLSPAFTLGIFFLVFSVFLKNGIPNFVIYLFAGLVVWNMFFAGVMSATSVIVDRAGLVKKVSFPREILPLSNVGSAVVYFAIQLGVLGLFTAALQHAPDWKFLLVLPLAFANLYFFTAAVGIVMSAMTVYLRDIKHLTAVALQLWFYLTPVVYSYENSLAPALHKHGLTALYFMNPLTLIVLTFQRTFYVSTTVISTVTHQPLTLLPTWSLAAFAERNLICLGFMILLFLGALAIFGRLEGNFESEL